MAAATLSDLHDAQEDGGLRNRVTAALSKSAFNVKNEDVGTPNHTKRFAWAKDVLVNNATNAANVTRYVVAAYAASNPTFDATTILAISDTDLQAQVDACIDLFAGV